MTSLELALLQGTLLIVIAPVCAGIGNTMVTLVKQKTWALPWVSYHRENSVVASVALGAALFFGILLPLAGLEGYASIYGNIIVLIAILGIVGGASALLDVKSIVPMALSAYGATLFALGITAASINSSNILLAISGDASISTVLTAIAIALVLIALRNDVGSERTRDVRMLLQLAIGVFLVNVLAMTTMANLLTHEQPVLNALIGIGKAIGIALVIDLLATGVRRYVRITPERLVRIAAFLGILAVIVAVWLSNPSL